MSDYPLGAQYDPRAPYNEKTKTVSVCVSVTYHKDIEVEVPEVVKELVYPSRLVKPMENFFKERSTDKYNIDNFSSSK